uniref:Opsin n=1 Tax=Conopomorpha sinensis TaxID=940481 RepID=A0AAU8BC23_9NEOP
MPPARVALYALLALAALHVAAQTKHNTNLCQNVQCTNLTSEKKCICYRTENMKLWKRRRRLSRAVESGTPAHGHVSLVARFKEQWPIGAWKRYMFTDDYTLLINPHWLKFSPPPAAVNYFLGGLYVVMMLVGCTGNALVLIMYIRCRSLRTPGNILVANLALSDFFMLAKTPVFIFNSFNMGPALGKTGCVIYGFLGGLTGCTSIATLASIALDRYWAIVRPLEPLRSLTAVRARIFALGAWLYAALFSSIPALDIGYGRYVPEGYLTSCSFDYLTDDLKPRYFIFAFFCAAWVAPFCTIIFCYLNILRIVVCQRNVSINKCDRRLSSRHVKEQVKRKAELKLAGLVIVVIALFFGSWTPYAVVALLGIFGKKDLVTPTSSMIPALFCKTAACINPFVYIMTHPKFRKEVRNFLYGEKSKRRSTFKTIGYTEANVPNRRISKDGSDMSEVEVVEMKDIPCQLSPKEKCKGNLRTLSSKVAEREGSQRSVSMKSFEEGVVPPPSWFAKPQFTKKTSFHRRSNKSVVSDNTDVIT